MPEIISGKLPCPPYTALAFDYGLSKLGVAVGQTQTATASPRGLVGAKDGIPQWERIDQLIAEWQPNLIVVGLPLNMDGSESDICRRARKFSRRLANRHDIPVSMMDERLSTREARNLTSGDPANAVDDLAAVLILESWFNLTQN
ncbi:MAG: Holliday junction resolvase RuvX [Pseudomonadales bacterium]